MNNTIIKLTKHEIKILKKKFQSLKFNNDFNLVYESQVPNTGFVLLNGELEIFKKKKVFSTVKPGNMLGVYELLNNAPVDHGCKVMGNSELIMIQKSDILAALDDKNSELYDILTKDIA
jgi:CRP-like cAMP-binding protein